MYTDSVPAGYDMLKIKKILYQIERNIDLVLAQDTTLGKDLWNIVLAQHPADIAVLVGRLDLEHQVVLFQKLPEALSYKVFASLTSDVQAALLPCFDVEHAAKILNIVSIDALSDLFDHLSDADLEKYLTLLQAHQRNQVLSLLRCDPNSAGGHMNSDVITLQKDFTVKRSIELLQRLGTSKALSSRMYVTDTNNVLVGYVPLDTLVLNKPETPLADIMLSNDLVVDVDDDQEDVANQMHHYGLSSAPVINKKNHFLGVITAKHVMDILEEEESEDVYKMSGLIPVKHGGYFSTPLMYVVLQRGVWLVGLLILQSVSSLILAGYTTMLNQYTIIAVFLTMLIGTGGNAGNQSATLVIRGLTTQEMTHANAMRVLIREFGIALLMSLILVAVAFGRVYWSTSDLVSSIAISISLFFIVITSTLLGASIPLIFDRLGIDPAHSAAPFLATLMDILGVLIYCFICSKFLG